MDLRKLMNAILLSGVLILAGLTWVGCEEELDRQREAVTHQQVKDVYEQTVHAIHRGEIVNCQTLAPQLSTTTTAAMTRLLDALLRDFRAQVDADSHYTIPYMDVLECSLATARDRQLPLNYDGYVTHFYQLKNTFLTRRLEKMGSSGVIDLNRRLDQLSALENQLRTSYYLGLSAAQE